MPTTEFRMKQYCFRRSLVQESEDQSDLCADYETSEILDSNDEFEEFHNEQLLNPNYEQLLLASQ